MSRSERLDHAEGVFTGFMVASGEVLYEGYGHGCSGVRLGDGQTQTEGVRLQDGRCDALMRRMSPHLIFREPLLSADIRVGRSRNLDGVKRTIVLGKL